MNVNHLPSTTGVYLFKKGTKILYIGKSVHIKARVLSHIESAKIDQKESKIVNNSDSVDYIVTDSEFKAVLLEAKLIQEHHPKYNVIWRDDKSHLYIKITVNEEFPKVLLIRRENDGKSRYFGPFSSVRTASMLLKEIRRIIPFCTQPRVSNRPCFYSKIGLCNPCPNEIKNDELQNIYRNNIKKIIKILSGNVKGVLNELYKELKSLSIRKIYEDAIKVRNKIFRFEELLYSKSLPADIGQGYNESSRNLLSLLKLLSSYFPSLNSLRRIECYDVSNLLLENASASMVVLYNGLIQRSEYKRFKVHDTKHRSDVSMLKEILTRRFKKDWKLPNLIIADGGKPQVRVVLKILPSLGLNIPIVGIAKNPDRLIIGSGKLPTLRFLGEDAAFNIIRLIRDESHRFARKYHLFLRDRNFLVY